MATKNRKRVAFRATNEQPVVKDTTEIGYQGLFRLGWARNVTSANNEIFVADHVNSQVKVYNKEGFLLDSLSTRDSRPLGVVAHPDGRVFVADSSMVKVYSLSSQQMWQQLYEFPPFVDCCGVNERPEIVSMVSTEDKTKILLGTRFNDFITVHDSNDGSPIVEDAPLAIGICPSYIDCGPSGHIIVSSYGVEDKVQIIDANGKLYHNIDPPEGVQSWIPSGVCFDKDGYDGRGCYYVANWAVGDRGIYVYSTSGHYLGVVTRDVYNPNGLSMAEDKKSLLVADDRSVKIIHLRED